MPTDLTALASTNWHPKLLPYFAMSLMALMMIVGLFDIRYPDDAEFPQALLIFPTAMFYLLSAIISELYGFAILQKFIRFAFLLLIVCRTIIQFSSIYLELASSGTPYPFVEFFSSYPRLIIASLGSEFIELLLVGWLMAKSNRQAGGRYFIGRVLLSSTAALFCGLAFYQLVGFGISALSDPGEIISGVMEIWLITMCAELPLLLLALWPLRSLKHHEFGNMPLSNSGDYSSVETINPSN